MVGYWLFKYSQNNDVTLIEFKSLDEIPNLIYPEVTICILNPFGKLFFEAVGVSKKRIYHARYVRYLQGDYNDKKSKAIRYDQVATNIKDHLEHLWLEWKTGRKPANYTTCTDIDNCIYSTFKNNYNGFIGHNLFVKCFGFGIKSEYTKDVSGMILDFKESWKTILKNVGMVQILFNFPNQLLRPRDGMQFIWHEKTANRMETFQITSVEILRRRNKRQKRCTEEWNNFDDIVLKAHKDK